VFWVISVYFKTRNTLPKSGTFLLGHPVYRVFHDFWTLLQEVISYVFVIKNVHINMCPILDGYGIKGIF